MRSASACCVDSDTGRGMLIAAKPESASAVEETVVDAESAEAAVEDERLMAAAPSAAEAEEEEEEGKLDNESETPALGSVDDARCESNEDKTGVDDCAGASEGEGDMAAAAAAVVANLPCLGPGRGVDAAPTVAPRRVFLSRRDRNSSSYRCRSRHSALKWRL